MNIPVLIYITYLIERVNNIWLNVFFAVKYREYEFNIEPVK